LKSKPELRRELMARRRSLSAADVAAASRAILAQLQETIAWWSVGSVHVYRSVAEWGELDTSEFVAWLAEERPKIEVVQPTLSKDQPFPERPFDVILVPALGFDRDNNRLGLGGGWYDRFVARQPQAETIGLAYAWALVEDGIPVEPWDMKLDRVFASVTDPIRLHLLEREVAWHVIEGGIEYLVSGWEQLASEVEANAEEWVWEEWLNDLDGREIIQDLFDNVPQSRTALDRVKRADERFVAATISTDECQWGAKNAADNGWTREKNWWYWREPRTQPW
jgi:5-formyltetrahydrofolate cyclo-ligase